MSKSHERPHIRGSSYASPYEHAPDLICTVDLESGRVLSCNRTFAEKVGRPREEIVDSPGERYFDRYDGSSLEEVWNELETEEEVQNVEVRVYQSGEGSFVASLSATVNREEDEHVALVFLRDISELKRAQRKLQRQTERLKQSNEELEQFAYLASHDLQEPLRMVASYTQLLARRYKGELDERADKYIDYAVEGAQRMKDLLNDLLEYSRIGRERSDPEYHDTDKLIGEVVANLNIRIAESDGTVDYDDLPDIYGDHSQLLRLFQNLIENGLKFSKEESPRVWVRGRREDDETVFEVEDDGIGFDTGNADRVFEVFQRLHDRNEFEGTGAGLSIVKKVVDYHGGEISVQSEPGEGTRFTIRLPAGPDAVQPQQQAS